MTLITIHRNIAIYQAEVPGAPLEWIDDAADVRGTAPNIFAAKQLINARLGVDPDCDICRGYGTEDWSFLACVPCPLCHPFEAPRPLPTGAKHD